MLKGIRQLTSLPAKRYLFTATANLANFKVPAIENEPNLNYAPGSPDNKKLVAAVEDLAEQFPLKVPLVIGGSKINTSTKISQLNPANHKVIVGSSASADAKHVAQAIDASLKAKNDWANMPFHERAAIFLKAADLIANKYRFKIMAATILGQGKNAFQAEIDAAAELVDFLKFNVAYAEELYSQQPAKCSPGIWNRAEYRPLEGFVYAVTPFNFTAIAGNLTVAPALMGNVVVWKPSQFAIISNYVFMEILEEAGLPAGVINFVPGDAVTVTKEVLNHPEFASLHYTGSTAVFKSLYKQIAANLDIYKSYPRIVGETGGKNFHLIHNSADIASAARNTIRGAFEFQGQKCSAASRVYVPKSIADVFISILKTEADLLPSTSTLSAGVAPSAQESVDNFTGPVIHEASFKKLDAVIKKAKKTAGVEVIAGGHTDSSVGYYVQPTILKVSDPKSEILTNEFFGPILGLYVYDDADYEATIRLIDEGSYGLTGAVFAQDRQAIQTAFEGLRNTAGNFYINDKCTGAVVGQQWFGGARLSGTNDKAGSGQILNRFVSIRNIKENFRACDQVQYY
ncbi:hypothetical protein CANCADRAFT_32308 [Tortispora caseinolytica NRRL Y-17796]|uniref:Multifunctional fusion protein n=1 Tax=Tortispora caseinolytica NRRL Y-17796 TaxID=767744 RepID=A0A1E4TB31_9ASCO|nr:hypothetical protein CANCADRAFT_32308 [Tortispora caseinolytica NRRL Y-17796]